MLVTAKLVGQHHWMHNVLVLNEIKATRRLIVSKIRAVTGHINMLSLIFFLIFQTSKANTFFYFWFPFRLIFCSHLVWSNFDSILNQHLVWCTLWINYLFIYHKRHESIFRLYDTYYTLSVPFHFALERNVNTFSESTVVTMIQFRDISLNENWICV